ncbi:response regulator [Musa troglodytarum]|uniref:Response regulator n=1 Tax=Musa troglodytarum TaxID=320322 RepID=A0A9E7G8Z3_9LILI|nr:response regulator [Musa troglodytarum]
MNSRSVAVEAGKEGLVGREDGQTDEFLVGMRVLAVDVATANQATVTIKLLRESGDKFDLAISDVHVLDMDGFKILEIVGLEMDLPVTKEEDDDSEKNMHEDEDPTTQGLFDRHQKFVAADNQLGIDKAAPKRILELIIVEKLTRENVCTSPIIGDADLSFSV